MEEKLNLAIDAFAEFAAQLTNGNSETIASSLKNEDGTFNPEGLTTLKDEHAKHIETLKTDKEKKFNDGDAKGFKRAMTAFERDLKSAHNMTSELRGIELVNELIADQRADAAKEAGNKNPAEVTEDQILKSPAYLTMEKRAQDAELKAESTEKIVTERFEHERTISSVRSQVKEAILAEKPVLSANATIAEKSVSYLVEEIMRDNTFAVVEGRTLILDADGNPKKNAHGFTVEFSEFVKSKTAESFDLQVSQERGSTGSEQHQNNGGGSNAMPKTEAEYRTQLMKHSRAGSESDLEAGRALLEYGSKMGW